MKIETSTIFTREIVKENPNKLYVFGENQKQQGTCVIGGGQAVIRGLPNTYGFCTLSDINEYWTDELFLLNVNQINTDIVNIANLDFPTVVFPAFGLGTGRAKLHIKAPHTFLYLCEKLLFYFEFNNLSQMKVKRF